MEHNPMLEAQKETEAAVASAKAETRARRKWAYVRENVLLAWAKRCNIAVPVVEGGGLAITDDLVRKFFEKDIEAVDAVVERSTDPELTTSFAVWTGALPPGYVRLDELNTWAKALYGASDTTSFEDLTLKFFRLEHDESAAVTCLEDGRGVFFAVRSTKRSPELPAFYVAPAPTPEIADVVETEPAPPPAVAEAEENDDA